MRFHLSTRTLVYCQLSAAFIALSLLLSPLLHSVFSVVFIFILWSSAMNINAKSKIKDHVVKVITIVAIVVAAATATLLFNTLLFNTLFNVPLDPKFPPLLLKQLTFCIAPRQGQSNANSYIYPTLKVGKRRKKRIHLGVRGWRRELKDHRSNKRARKYYSHSVPQDYFLRSGFCLYALLSTWRDTGVFLFSFSAKACQKNKSMSKLTSKFKQK